MSEQQPAPRPKVTATADEVARLAVLARWTSTRLRVDAALRRAAALAPYPLLYGVALLTWMKLGHPSLELQAFGLYAAVVPAAVFVAGVVLVAVRRQPHNLGSLTLDRHHGLHDRITTALAFQAIPTAERSPLMTMAMEDAVATVTEASPGKAAPLAFPREVPLVAVLVAGLVGLSFLRFETTSVMVYAAPTRPPAALTQDDLDLFRKMLEEAERNSPQDVETQAAIRRFNQLIEDMAQRRLDRKEIFKRLQELEQKLKASVDADEKATQEGLEALARELDKSSLSKPVSKALRQKKLEDAEKALEELAKKLKRATKKPSKAELEKLRKALEKASKSNEERLQRIEQQRQRIEEERRSLLKKKKKQQGKLTPEQQRMLRKKERQLERLDRQKQRAKHAKKKMSKLDRELAKAAQQLLKEMGQAAKSLQEAAQDINRMSRQKMGDKQKRELIRQLKQLRQLLRQQGKGGKKRRQRMLDFQRRARGGKPRPGQGQQGQQGQGKGPGRVRLVPGGGGTPIPMPGKGQGRSMGQGKGQGQQPGQGQGQGKGQGQGQGKGQGQGQGKGQGQGQGKGQQPGQGSGPGGGEQWGSGGGGDVAGDKTAGLKGKSRDVSAAAVDTGEGTASAQVIMGAARRGFVGRGYQKVYTDYKTVAEEVMNDDEIPPGYRFYVRRYFQLIRPRE